METARRPTAGQLATTDTWYTLSLPAAGQELRVLEGSLNA